MKRPIVTTMKLSSWMDDDDPAACASPRSAQVRDALLHWPRQRRDTGLRAARLMAVAAAYDELTATRGPRRAMAPDDASAVLVRRAGVDLDPDAVRAWLYAQEVRPCF